MSKYNRPRNRGIMTLAESMEYLNLGKQETRQLAYAGELRGAKKKGNGHWQIPKRSLDEWIEKEFNLGSEERVA
jgi:excisionase family DNA binding protein